MKKLLHLLSQIIEVAAICCFGILFALVVLQVVGRFAGINGIGWTDEMISCFTTWMAMLGAGYLAERRQHVQVTMFIDGIKGVVNRLLWVLIEIFNICCGIGFAVSGYLWSSANIGKITPGLKIQYNIWYIAICAFGCLYTFFSVFNLLDRIIAVFKPEQAETVNE